MKSKMINLLVSVLFCSTASCSSTKEITKSESRPERVQIRTTAYTSAEADHRKYGKKTAIGTTLKSGVIATDWSIFPVGTKLKINNQIFIVEDFGSALIKKHANPTIDVYVTSLGAVKRWGVKNVTAEVVEMGSFERSAALLKPRTRYKHCRLMYEKITTKYLN